MIKKKRNRRKTIAPVVIAVIQDPKNRVLLTRRVDPPPSRKKPLTYHRYWQLPGGSLEFGETPTDAVRREVMEETGLILDEVTPIPFIYTQIRSYWQGVFLSFHCTIPTVDPKITLNKEADSYQFVHPSDFGKMALMPGTKQILKHIR